MPLIEVSRGEKMTLRGTDPESYITEYTLVYGDKTFQVVACSPGSWEGGEDHAGVIPIDGYIDRRAVARHRAPRSQNPMDADSTDGHG